MTATEMSYEYTEIDYWVSAPEDGFSGEHLPPHDAIAEPLEDGSIIGDGREASELPAVADTAITREQVLNEFARWQQGEQVPSEVASIAQLPGLSEDELAILHEFTGLYQSITDNILGLEPPRVDPGTPNETQLEIIRSRYEAFIRAVRNDAIASGVYEAGCETMHEINVGIFSPVEDALSWHTDRTGSPTLRYTASLGEAGSTLFATGRGVRSSDTDIAGVLSQAAIEQSGHFKIVQPDTGDVSRFLANQGVHRSPAVGGFRLFFSVDILVADEPPRLPPAV